MPRSYGESAHISNCLACLETHKKVNCVLKQGYISRSIQKLFGFGWKRTLDSTKGT